MGVIGRHCPGEGTGIMRWHYGGDPAIISFVYLLVLTLIVWGFLLLNKPIFIFEPRGINIDQRKAFLFSGIVALVVVLATLTRGGS